MRIWADGNDLGTTSTQGTLHVELRGHEGQAVALTTACPPGYRTLTPRRRVVLQHDAALALQIGCEPNQRSAILIVRARGPGPAPLAGVPIRKDGVVVAQTDLEGTAHVRMLVRPASSLRIALDTSAWPELVPRDPVQSYELADEDSLLLVDQTFTTRAPASAQAARRTRRPDVSNASRPPYRIR